MQSFMGRNKGLQTEARLRVSSEMKKALQSELDRLISEAKDAPFVTKSTRRAGGGCIHQSYLLMGDSDCYFVKINEASKADVFAAEADSLRAIHEAGVIACPAPIAEAHIAGHSALVMEALIFGSSGADGWSQMGRQLAALHRVRGEQFGWHRDNYIGESPQSNSRTANWADFFCEQRLLPQLQMAADRGLRFRSAEALLDAARRLLEPHRPEPALCHGDLWSGNASFLSDGTPVIYDPASYYGDRETDLAFSEFFGGFPPTFYSAYQSVWPLPGGYEQRKTLYNLYHVINHANLFGGSYASQAQTMIGVLLQQG
jgi:fructosamine-3-kinase